MASYFGCGTTQNKVRWGLFAGFSVISVVFLIMSIIQMIILLPEYNDCVTEREELLKERASYYRFEDEDARSYCYDQYEVLFHYLFSYLVVFFVFGVASSIPLFVMKSCSNQPESENTPETGPSTNVHPAIEMSPKYQQMV